MTVTRSREILEDPDFKTMSGRKRRIAAVLTLAELGLYFGFIALIAFDKPLLSGKLFAGAATTIGIPIAVGVIFLSWALTGAYVWWANAFYDASVKRVRDRIGAWDDAGR